MQQNNPPNGWYHLWGDDSQQWAPFVRNEHIYDYVGPSFQLFKEQFGNRADVDNITVKAVPSALEALIPQGTVTVTAGKAVHKRTPKGMALLLSSPCVFVKETDKQKILDVACTDEFSHFSYCGNTSKKVIFCGETFTPDQVFKLLNLAEVKEIQFVSFAMKGSPQWAHQVLLNLQQKMDGDSRQLDYRVLIDFAVTIQPQLCHLSQEGTHQCAPHDPSNRATQFVPLSMVDRERAIPVFGSDTQVANYPSFCDAQFSENPSTPPLFGGSTIFPKATSSDMLEKNHSNKDVDAEEDEDGNIVPLIRSTHCNVAELNDVLKVVIYPDITHLLKQHVGRGKNDVVAGATTVRTASRVVNQLSKFAEHAMGGGVETGLRLEATVAIPNSHIFARYDAVDHEADDPPESLLDQFDFAFFPLWKAFHIQRIVLVPYTSICDSMIRYYIFASLANLPINLQIMSGSNDSNQVGDRLKPATAKYYGVLLAKNDKLVRGSENRTEQNRRFFGKTTLPPRNQGVVDHDNDADDAWTPSGEEDDNGSTVQRRTRGSDRIAEATEQKEGGRLSRDLTNAQKCFLALYCVNCGCPNKLANKLLARQFGPGPMAPDNSFIWIVFQVWTFYIQMLQTELHNDLPYTKRELEELLVNNLLPGQPPRPAEAGAAQLGMYQCQPPAITRPAQNSSEMDDHLADGEMYLYLHSRKTRGQFSRIRIGSTNPACVSRNAFFSTLWLMQTGGTHLDIYHCPLSQTSTAAIASTLSNDSVLTDAVLLAEVRHYGKFFQSKNKLGEAKLRTTCKTVPASGDIPKTHGGTKFQEGKDIDDIVRRTTNHILNTNKKQSYINKSNWKTYLNIRTDVPELSAQEIYLAQRGVSATEARETDWLLQKLETVLVAVLRIHRHEISENLYCWAAFNVCSTPCKLRNTPTNVIKAVAQEITEDENLRKTWPHRLETEVDSDYAHGSSNEIVNELYEQVLSRALFQKLFDGDHPLDIVCTRYNPINASGSWRRPYTIGRTKIICARKAAKRLYDENILINWEHVIMPSRNEGFPHSVDSMFDLRHSFTLPRREYDDIELDESMNAPMEYPLAQNYLDVDLNIVNHSKDAPQGEQGNPLAGAGAANDDSDDDQNDSSNDYADYDPQETWNPRLGGRQKHSVPAWKSRKRAKIKTSNVDTGVDLAVQSNMSPTGDGVEGNADHSCDFSSNLDEGVNGNDGANMDTNLLEDTEIIGRSSWFAAFLASMDALVKDNIIAVFPIDGHQGRFPHTHLPHMDSTSGCFMISALTIVKLLESDILHGLSNNEFNTIMDTEAPPLLVEMRSMLGMEAFHDANISETFDFLYGKRLCNPNLFKDAVGGNILDGDTLHRLFTKIEDQQCAKVGVSLFFRKHVITIMKIEESYEIFESLPVWDTDHSIKILMDCQEMTFQAVLLCYASCKLKDIRVPEVFDEYNESDPRIFEAHIFANSTNESEDNLAVPMSVDQNSQMSSSANVGMGDKHTGNSNETSQRYENNHSAQRSETIDGSTNKGVDYIATPRELTVKELFEFEDWNEETDTPRELTVKELFEFVDWKEETEKRGASWKSSSSKNYGWRCNVCKKPFFNTYEDALLHEKECIGTVTEGDGPNVNLENLFHGEISSPYPDTQQSVDITTPAFYSTNKPPPSRVDFLVDLYIHDFPSEDSAAQTRVQKLKQWVSACRCFVGAVKWYEDDESFAPSEVPIFWYGFKPAEWTTTIGELIGHKKLFCHGIIPDHTLRPQGRKRDDPTGYGKIKDIVYIHPDLTLQDVVKTYGQIYNVPPHEEHLLGNEEAHKECTLIDDECYKQSGIVLVLLSCGKITLSEDDLLFYKDLSNACSDTVMSQTSQFEKVFGVPIKVIYSWQDVCEVVKTEDISYDGNTETAFGAALRLLLSREEVPGIHTVYQTVDTSTNMNIGNSHNNQVENEDLVSNGVENNVSENIGDSFNGQAQNEDLGRDGDDADDLGNNHDLSNEDIGRLIFQEYRVIRPRLEKQLSQIAVETALGAGVRPLPTLLGNSSQQIDIHEENERDQNFMTQETATVLGSHSEQNDLSQNTLEKSSAGSLNDSDEDYVEEGTESVWV